MEARVLKAMARNANRARDEERQKNAARLLHEKKRAERARRVADRNIALLAGFSLVSVFFVLPALANSGDLSEAAAGGLILAISSVFAFQLGTWAQFRFRGRFGTHGD